MECTRCKAENKDNYKFCYRCGLILTEDIDEFGIKKLTKEECNKLLDLSYVFEVTNSIDEAIEAYELIINSYPGWADVHFKLGRAYEVKGERGKALREYKKAIAINPDYIDAHRCLGEIYSEEGLYEEAIKEFNLLLNIQQDYKYADVMNSLVEVYIEQGNLVDSEEILKKVIEINPKYAKAKFNLARIAYLKGEKEKAASFYKEAFELDKELVIAEISLNALLEELGKKELG